jgi:hypothetical protein
MTRTELLNALVAKYGYQSYLEIGVRDPRLNFDKVEAPQKLGCDPRPTRHRPGVAQMPSNEFFETVEGVWQLIFVDGDHSAAQSWTDIQNAVARLAPGGTVVVHDVNPLEASHQGAHYVPTPANPDGYFMGEVWRSWLRARMLWPSLTVIVRDDLDSPADCGIIQPWNDKLIPLPVKVNLEQMSYEDFVERPRTRRALLDLSTWELAQEAL